MSFDVNFIHGIATAFTNIDKYLIDSHLFQIPWLTFHWPFC